MRQDAATRAQQRADRKGSARVVRLLRTVDQLNVWLRKRNVRLEVCGGEGSTAYIEIVDIQTGMSTLVENRSNVRTV